MVFKGRHEADDSLRGSGSDGRDVGMAGGRVVRLYVDATGPANDLAAVKRTLQRDARHPELFEFASSHEPVPLHVP